MKLIYQVDDKPKFGALVVFAIQQLLAIMTATLVVPIIINSNPDLVEKFGEGAIGMSSAAALFGAGAGTLVYVLFTKRKSPVFLGSSFAFLNSMAAAFAGATTVAVGYVGLLIGAVAAGLVYVVIAVIVRFVGVKWISKMMPAVVIGPTVSIIGLSLAGNAVGDLTSGGYATTNVFAALCCGLVCLFVTTLCSVYGKRLGKLIPFIFGILAGYVFSLLLTLIGMGTGAEGLMVLNFAPFSNLVENGVTLQTFFRVPDFTFLTAMGSFKAVNASYIGTVLAAYIPVAFVVFAEHIADHKNISSIIEKDLLEDPGLHRTLLGDGVGSMVGAFFGGCPNTTYGESIGCVAITKNASVWTIITAAVGAILISFLSPFVAFVNSIPSCVMGGVCMALYGFIAVSGLKMIQKVDLNKNKNLFVVSVILIAGIGGLSVSFGNISITPVACALILGIITNLMLKNGPEEEIDNASAKEENEK